MPSSIRVWFRRLLPWIVSAACVYIILKFVPMSAIASRLSEIDIWWLAMAMIAVVINLLARGIRIGLILSRSDPQSLFWIISISNVGMALNALLPGKVGEVVKVVLNTRIMGVGSGQAVMAALIERILDLTILSVLAWYAIGQVDLSESEYGRLLEIFSNALMALCFLFLLAIACTRLNRFSRAVRRAVYKLFYCLPRFRRQSIRFIRDAEYISRNFMRTALAVRSISASLVMWLTCVLVIFLVAKAMPSMELGLMACLIIGALTTLAAALPAAPGGWGAYEAVGLFVTKQIAPHYSLAEIGAFIIASHFVQYFTVILIGFCSCRSFGDRLSISALVDRNP